MADLDAVGNTTKAITKGVAIASAVIAAVSLVRFLYHRCRAVQTDLVSNLASHQGTGIRSCLEYQVCSSVSFWWCAALVVQLTLHPRREPRCQQIVEEVRRQFRIPGIMEGTSTPDYARVVGISTARPERADPAGDHRGPDAVDRWPDP